MTAAPQSSVQAPTTALTVQHLATLASDFAARPELRRSLNAVTRAGVDEVALDHAVATGISPSMSHRIDDWKVTNQKKSGRCWLFAALNLMRQGAKAELGVKEFEFSQNHAMYFDKLERANYFLTSIVETAEMPVDARLPAFLLETVLGDGGQWNMAVSLFAKHGVVPQEAMPETQSSSDTKRMNASLQTVLRRGAARLRQLVTIGAEPAEVDTARRDVVADVHRVLTIHLGVPPSTVDWQWTDDDKTFHRVGALTPQEFSARYVTIDLADYVCLVDDPRPEHPKGATLTVEHLGNVVGGEPVRYLNVDIGVAKAAARESIVAGEPVWFGCDVAQQMQRNDGVWDAALFDYAGVYATELAMDKETRVRHHDSLMTHAMLLTGVDVLDGVSRRWRVENSWGSDSGRDGYYTMNDSWFDEHVFEVVVRKSRLSDELRAALEDEPIVLPAWDPMGALARG